MKLQSNNLFFFFQFRDIKSEQFRRHLKQILEKCDDTRKKFGQAIFS